MSNYWALLKVGSIIILTRELLCVPEGTLGVVNAVYEEVATVVFEGGALYNMYHTDLDRYAKVVVIDTPERAPNGMKSSLPAIGMTPKTLSMFAGLYNGGKFNKYFAIGRHLMDNKPSSHLLEEEVI